MGSQASRSHLPEFCHSPSGSNRTLGNTTFCRALSQPCSNPNPSNTGATFLAYSQLGQLKCTPGEDGPLSSCCVNGTQAEATAGRREVWAVTPEQQTVDTKPAGEINSTCSWPGVGAEFWNSSRLWNWDQLTPRCKDHHGPWRLGKERGKEHHRVGFTER